MKLFLVNINEILPRHIELISPERAEKARRFRFPDDRKRSIAAGLLLKRFVGEERIFTDKSGKPRAEGICFNLSHSGGWAALAVSDDPKNEVGCDIEQIRQADALRLGRVVFTDNELQRLSEAPDRLGRFYDFWTKKEALLKCMGEGFHRAAKTVDVSGGSFEENGVRYEMKTRRFADYTVSVCVCGASADYETEVVHFREY